MTLVMGVAAAALACWGTTNVIQWDPYTSWCPSGTFAAQGLIIGSSPLGAPLQASGLTFGPMPSFSGSADVNHIARCWDQLTVLNSDASAPGCVYAHGPLSFADASPVPNCLLPPDAAGVEVIFYCTDEQVP